jgi:hypothetical protein
MGEDMNECDVQMIVGGAMPIISLIVLLIPLAHANRLKK